MNGIPKEEYAFGLYYTFLDLSFRITSKEMTCRIIKRSHVVIWKLVQNYERQKG